MIFSSLIVAVATQAGGPAIVKDPAFQASKLLVGTWEGSLKNGTKVRVKFVLEQDGALLVGNGLINPGSKHPLTMKSSLGWDADAKQVYYLDQHGNSTVYFGHVTKEGDNLVFDFKGLCGDSGHYRSRAHVTADTYTNSMEAEQNGTWKDMGFHLTLHKVK